MISFCSFDLFCLKQNRTEQIPLFITQVRYTMKYEVVDTGIFCMLLMHVCIIKVCCLYTCVCVERERDRQTDRETERDKLEDRERFGHDVRDNP